jgi:hypothetical protein
VRELPRWLGGKTHRSPAGINYAIQQLSDLLPDQMLEPIGTGQTTHHTHHKTNSTASVTSVMSNGSDSGPGTPGELHLGASGSLSALRPNKRWGLGSFPERRYWPAGRSVVLHKAVEYMQYLKQLCEAQNTRNQELEAMVGGMSRHQISESDPSAFSFAHAQSTEALFDDDPMQT